MRGSRSLGWLLVLIGCGLGSPAFAETPRKPKLAVMIFFDQLRGDYLTRWEPVYGPGGFKRLMKDGTWYRECHYPYAYTVTGAGHASVATGFPPSVHGVIGNDWYERTSSASVNCVSSERYSRVPAKMEDPPKTGETPKKPRGVAPDRLLRPTIADAFRAAGGRIVSVSFKDRGAVLPGGKEPNACYWLDSKTGEFITSTYYRERLHPWAEAFNRSGTADTWRDTKWERFRPDLDYVRLSGIDDNPGEGKGTAQGRTFPHPFGDGKERSSYYSALYNSPFGNDLLLAFAKEAVKNEQLGKDETTDFLSISFSSNDAIGHTWGPDSQEVLDVTLRSDALMKQLLDFLDAEVGAGQYVLVLTADHGVCPLPERSREQGLDAARIAPSPLIKEAEAHLSEVFGEGKGRWLESTAGAWLYVSAETATARGAKPEMVHAELAKWLRSQPGIQTAYTRAELMRDDATDDRILKATRLSFYPERSGDIFVVIKPYHLMSNPLDTGTTHGMPHRYDTHVPLMVFGTTRTPGPRDQAVSPLMAASILAEATGLTIAEEAALPPK